VIDERYQTSNAMIILGVVGTWIIENPTEFVTMTVAVGGFVIMLAKYLEERVQRNEQHRLDIRRKKLEIEKLENPD
jgi:hypothetical protein